MQRPEGTKAADALPVLVSISGDGCAYGNTGKHNADALLKHATERTNSHFIFVAINYRAAGFGFLGGKEIVADGASNIGLLDQRMALKWFADNIESFGGDPSKVTLWGESSGSVWVLGQMLLYDGNAKYNGKPLFSRAIVNSGTIAPADNAEGPSAQKVYDAVVKEAGCSGASNTLHCLRDLSYKDFSRATNDVPRVMSEPKQNNKRAYQKVM